MRLTTKILAVGLLGLAACNGSPSTYGLGSYSDTVTHQQEWNRQDEVRKQDQAYNGFNGTLTCYTSTGACVTFDCSTRASCDYMKNLEKECKAPPSESVPCQHQNLAAGDVYFEPRGESHVLSNNGVTCKTDGAGITSCN